MHTFLEDLTDYLTTVEHPFSTSIQALTRYDKRLRNILANLNRHSCCNVNPYSNIPHERHYLQNQLLILSLDPEAPVRNQDPPPETKCTCQVCFDDDTRRFQVTRNCAHEGSVCLACLARHIAAQLECKRWNDLTCPLCPAKLDGDVVEKYGSKETVER